MADLFREAPFGQLVRFLSGDKLFRYPEEKEDFRCPHCYQHDDSPPSEKILEERFDGETHDAGLVEATRTATYGTKLELEKTVTSSDPSSEDDQGQEPVQALGLQRTQTLPFSSERYDVERRLAVERSKSRPILPARTADVTILVDWYNTDDPANPQNWSQKKKAFVAFQIT